MDICYFYTCGLINLNQEVLDALYEVTEEVLVETAMKCYIKGYVKGFIQEFIASWNDGLKIDIANYKVSSEYIELYGSPVLCIDDIVNL